MKVRKYVCIQNAFTKAPGTLPGGKLPIIGVVPSEKEDQCNCKCIVPPRLVVHPFTPQEKKTQGVNSKCVD